jgi:hypothetical protein
MTGNNWVQKRKRELLERANLIIHEIGALNQQPDALGDPQVLTAAIKMKIMEAPQLIRFE